MLTTVTLNNIPCVVPQRSYGAAARRANSYWCPLGAAAGKAWVLMLGRDLDAVAGEQGNDAGAEHRLEFTSYENGRAAARVTLPRLLLTRSTRVAPGPPNDGHAVHLVELADRRFLVERFSDTGVVTANVRAAASAADYLVGTSGVSWPGLCETLWNRMEAILGPFPGLPAGVEPQGSPEHWLAFGENAWRALNDVLAQLGCAAAYRPQSGAFAIERLAAPLPAAMQNALQNAKTIGRRDESRHAPAALAPEAIRVYFHTRYRAYGQERDTELDNNWIVQEAAYSIDVPSGEAATIAGTVLPLWDDLPRVLDENGEVENAEALGERAAARAAQWLAGRAVDRPLDGAARWIGLESSLYPTGAMKAVVWRAAGPLGGTTTEAIAGPRLPALTRGGRDILRGFVWSDDAAAPAGEPYANNDNARSPQLARRGLPLYPRLANAVQVWQGAALPGTWLSPHSDGLYLGRLRRWVAGGLAVLGACWIRPVTLAASGIVGEVVPLRQADAYVGRLSGIATSGGVTLPLYLIHTMPGQPAPIVIDVPTVTIVQNTPQGFNGGPVPLNFELQEPSTSPLGELTVTGEFEFLGTGTITVQVDVSSEVDDTSATGPSRTQATLEFSNGGDFTPVAGAPISLAHNECGKGTASGHRAAVLTVADQDRLRVVVTRDCGSQDMTTTPGSSLIITPLGEWRPTTLASNLLASFAPEGAAGDDQISTGPSGSTAITLLDNGAVDRAAGHVSPAAWAFSGNNFFVTADRVVAVANDESTDNQYSWTITFWFYYDSTPGGALNHLIWHGPGPDLITSWEIFCIYGSSTQTLEAGISLYTTPTIGNVTATGLAHDAWHFVALRWRQSTQMLSLRVDDGAWDAVSATGTNQGLAEVADTKLYVGSNGLPGEGLRGLMDGLAIHQRYLSDGEIEQLWNAGTAS